MRVSLWRAELVVCPLSRVASSICQEGQKERTFGFPSFSSLFPILAFFLLSRGALCPPWPPVAMPLVKVLGLGQFSFLILGHINWHTILIFRIILISKRGYRCKTSFAHECDTRKRKRVPTMSQFQSKGLTMYHPESLLNCKNHWYFAWGWHRSQCANQINDPQTVSSQFDCFRYFFILIAISILGSVQQYSFALDI